MSGSPARIGPMNGADFGRVGTATSGLLGTYIMVGSIWRRGSRAAYASGRQVPVKGSQADESHCSPRHYGNGGFYLPTR